MVRASRLIVGIVCLLALGPAGCSKMKGRLTMTVRGRPAEIRSAYAVSVGGKGFQLHVSNQRRSCAWAEGRGTGSIPAGEVHASFDVVPALQPGGSTRWEIVGGGWVGDSRAGWDLGNLGFPRWPIGVKSADPRCPGRVTIDKPKEASDLSLEGDFTPECCSENVTLASGPMTVRIGNETYFLARAGVTERAGFTSVRIVRVQDPCTGMATDEDLTLHFDVDPATNAARGISLGGHAAPPPWFRGDETKLTVTRSETTLALRGSFEARRFMEPHGPTIEAVVDGAVPLVQCTGR